MAKIIETNTSLFVNSSFIKEKEMADIKLWFTNYYTIHEQKLNRLISLEVDVESNRQLLIELYQEAESKRLRYQQLEKQLGGGE